MQISLRRALCARLKLTGHSLGYGDPLKVTLGSSSGRVHLVDGGEGEGPRIEKSSPVRRPLQQAS